MDAQLSEIAVQASELSQRCMLALGGKGDRAPYLLHAEAVFPLGAPTVQKLTFNVPADADFFGERLNLFLQYRIVDTVTTTVLTTDRAFRPCRWSSQADLGFSGFTGIPESNAAVSIKDDDNGPYQSAAFNVASLFSSMYGVNFGPYGAAVSQYGGGCDFFVPYIIGRGKAAEMEVTPLYSLALGATQATSYMASTQRVQFRVVGVFHGYKNVRAFK